MSFDSIMKGFGQQNINVTLDAMKEVAKDQIQELAAEQTDSKMAFLNSQEEAINPFAAKYATRQKPIKSSKTRIQKMLQSGEKAHKLLPVEQIKHSADQFQRRNPELRANVLT